MWSSYTDLLIELETPLEVVRKELGEMTLEDFVDRVSWPFKTFTLMVNSSSESDLKLSSSICPSSALLLGVL